jgi:5-methyltetrahydropteroyltriglutamate--homocysteine methyltransferase
VLFPTSLVGSYPQPDWLIDREKLAGRFPPRVRGVLADLVGKTIILGVLDLSTPDVETPEQVAARARRALPFAPADRIVLAPDCGMKYLPRDAAAGKLTALTQAAGLLRAELAG